MSREVNPLRYINEGGGINGVEVGGDLDGTLPNPTLAVIGAAAGPVGNASTVAAVTVDEKGRVTALTAVPITFPPADVNGVAVGGDLDGTLPNPTLKVIGAGGTVGNSTNVAQITYDTKGRITAATSVPIAFPAAGVKAYYLGGLLVAANISAGNNPLAIDSVEANIGFTEVTPGTVTMPSNGYLLITAHLVDSISTASSTSVRIIRNGDYTNWLAETRTPASVASQRNYQLTFMYPVTAGETFNVGVNTSGNVAALNAATFGSWITFVQFTLF